MGFPKRLKRYAGQHAMVDGIPFQLPVTAESTPAFLAIYTINADKAKELMPGNEIHPYRLWKKGLLIITVINYQVTTIGKYVEFSIAIACTRGARPAPRFLPAIFRKRYGFGQFVYDLPVSTEISVKGGRGIWGMPKHQANLNFFITDETVSSQYDKDGHPVLKVEIMRPQRTWFPGSMAVASYSHFRGMLMRSHLYFKGKTGFAFFKKGRPS